MIRGLLIFAAAGTLAACDGPVEDAGEKADNASGVVSSEDTTESGPQETMGEQKDEAREAVEDAKEAVPMR